jgi:hypothetical protein
VILTDAKAANAAATCGKLLPRKLIADASPEAAPVASLNRPMISVRLVRTLVNACPMVVSILPNAASISSA